jgi:hypothetical protein
MGPPWPPITKIRPSVIQFGISFVRSGNCARVLKSRREVLVRRLGETAEIWRDGDRAEIRRYNCPDPAGSISRAT